MYLQQDDQHGENKKIEDEEDSNTSRNDTSISHSDMNKSSTTTASSDIHGDSGISEKQDSNNTDHKIYSNIQSIGQVSQIP